VRPTSKSFLKKQAAYARMKALPKHNGDVLLVKGQKGDSVTLTNGVPTKLYQGQPGAGMWDVYFNGVKQHLCTYASSIEGKIVRYTHGRGNTPLSKQTEELAGSVVIVRKGTPMPAHLIVSPATAEDMEKKGLNTQGVEVLPRVRTTAGRRRVGPSSIMLAAAIVAASMGSDDGKA
jgi:hypothetical protein